MNNITDIEHGFYINLDIRTQRRILIEKEIINLGLNLTSITRFSAICLKEQPSAIGCSLSHLRCLENAIKQKWNHCLILEDDFQCINKNIFCNQLNIFLQKQKDINNIWDVILFAGNNIPPYEPIDNCSVRVLHCQTTTGYLVNGHYITKLADNIRKGLQQLIHNPQNHINFAIDRYWFNLQKIDKWYLIIPLTNIQRADYSDIEKKQVDYKNIMLDIDKPYILEKIKIGYKFF